MSNRPAKPQQHQTEQAKTAMAIAITSGKGGVGKTNITCNLALELAKNGHKVCIFDADTSLANINILLGLTPEFTLEQFLNGEKNIEDILLSGPEGVKIVPSASGIAELAELQADQQSRIVEGLRALEQQFDYILIDTAAGISDNVIRFLQSAQYAVVVISPEPTSLTDAFSLIKVLQRRNYDKPIYTLVNMAKNYKHSMDVFKRFSHAVNKYVHLKIRYLGYIPMDAAMRSAVASQSPVVLSEPLSPSARCMTLLTQILLKHFKVDNEENQSVSEFWNNQAADNEPALSSVEAAGTHIEPSDHNMGIIEAQKIKEVNRILELATDALNNQDFSQQQTEELLTSTLKNHLEQFGSLPDDVMSLLPEVQQNAEPEAKASITKTSDEIRISADQNSSPEITVTNDPEPVPPVEKAPLMTTHTSPVEALREEIDRLVSDAIRTKKELAELSSYLKDQYRALYNTDHLVSNKTHDLSSSETKPQQISLNKQREDQLALKQSIRYASAVDGKG